jgi:hypothetical protein
VASLETFHLLHSFTKAQLSRLRTVAGRLMQSKYGDVRRLESKVWRTDTAASGRLDISE